MINHDSKIVIKPRVPQLFCDDALIESTHNVWRSLHQGLKHQNNPLLLPDRPWEGYLVLQPGSVIYDPNERIFKMWYNAQPSRSKPDVDNFLCLAVSRDGINWEKPELGITEFKNSRRNNIVMRGVEWTHGVLLDPEETEPGRKYKLLYWRQGINAAFSADGLHWQDYDSNPVVPRWASGDTFSVMRDPCSRQYWLYHKTRGEPVRTVSRLISDDFTHWRDSRRVLAPDAFDPPDTQFYGLSPFPSGGQCLGWLWVYHTYAQTMDVQLVASRDGLHWHRCANRKLLIHLVPTNRYQGGAFDSMMIYPASAPVMVGKRMGMYYSGFTVPHNAMADEHDGCIGLATWRRDGFCSFDATSRGEIVTRPFVWPGGELIVNAAVRGPETGTATGDEPKWRDLFPGTENGRGFLKAAVEKEDGSALNGFTLSDCRPVQGDNETAEVNWRSGRNSSELSGRMVRLRFILNNMSLFSWQTGT